MTDMVKKKRAKRKLLIDIRLPDAEGSRVTIKGDDLTVKPEALDAWQAVAERMLEIVAEHMNRKSPARSDGRSRTP